jgi:predicted Zn finger-like uncharacterized protein
MRITCESCNTCYEIPDGRVVGKSYTIRCKRCERVIDIGRRREAPPRWHLVQEGMQVGPLTTLEVSESILEAEIGQETYIWREGLSDWVPLGQIETFAHLRPTMMEQPQPARAGDLFGPAQPVLVGSRSESSVLFSIANLKDLAHEGGQAGAARTGSGLIDIRALARGSSRSGKSDEGDSFSLDAVTPGYHGALLMPVVVSDEQSPRWLFPTMIGMGSMLAAAVVVLVLALLYSQPEVKVAPQPPPPTPTPAVPTTSPKVEVDDYDEVISRGATPVHPKLASAKPSPGMPKAITKRRPRPIARGKTFKPSVRRRPPQDELGRLIDEAIKNKGHEHHTATASPIGPAPILPPRLTKAQIQRGMHEIKGQVQRCFDRYRVPGWAKLNVTISSRGKVRAARVRGIFSGTPTGACVQTAASAARFPAFRDGPITIDYPIMLRGRGRS